ncbi:MAG: hypothetical protein H6926_01575 [Chromatiales bacterium]|nr:hypothetical protein [Chromatiales bacterium]
MIRLNLLNFEFLILNFELGLRAQARIAINSKLKTQHSKFGAAAGGAA